MKRKATAVTAKVSVTMTAARRSGCKSPVGGLLLDVDSILKTAKGEEEPKAEERRGEEMR
jgi:hypothetical protein